MHDYPYPNPKARGMSPTVLLLLASVFAGLTYFLFVRSKGQMKDGPIDPPTISGAQLRQLPSPEALRDPWVTYEAPQVVDLGLSFTDKVRRRGSRASTAHYLLAQVEDRWIVVEVSSKFSGHRFIGRVERWDTPVRKGILQQVRGVAPTYADWILPYQLTVGESYPGANPGNANAAGAVVCAVLALILGIRAIWKAMPQAPQRQDPLGKRPTVRELDAGYRW